MRATKQRTFVYKKIQFLPLAAKLDLSTLLHITVTKSQTIGDRRQNLGPPEDAAEWLVIGDYQGDASMFFGVLMRYAPDTAAATLLDNALAKRVKVETFIAPKEGQTKREFIDGSLYFGVSGNHVVLMQSTAVRDRTLENHLQWLLHHVKVIPEDHTLCLADRPTKAAKDLIEESPVRRLVLDGELFEAPKSSAPLAGQAASPDNAVVAQSRSTGVSGKVWEAVRLLAGRSNSAKLDLSDLDATKLSYSLQLRYDGRRAEIGGNTLDKIGKALRNADGINATIELDNGNKIDNGMLRVSGTVRIETLDGVPNPASVFEHMRHWLLERISSRDV